MWENVLVTHYCSFVMQQKPWTPQWGMTVSKCISTLEARQQVRHTQSGLGSSYAQGSGN